jgi:hypothetical protein
MKIITLDNQEIEWKPKKTNHRISKLQQKAIELILKVIPGTLILTEIPLPITKSRKVRGGAALRADIFIIRHKIIVEVMGRQHFCRVNHFQTRIQHNKQLINDDIKRQWCELNQIPLIYFNFNETIETWEEKLRGILYSHR